MLTITLVRILYFTILSEFCIKCVFSVENIKANLILNVFDYAGLQGASWFIDSVKLYNKPCLGDIYLFLHEHTFQDYKNITSTLSSTGVKVVTYKNNGPLPYLGIGRPDYKREHVLDIIESWSYVSDLLKNNIQIEAMFLSVTFEINHLPVATPNFLHIFERLGTSSTTRYGLVLLGKVSRLTSVSDWHDLSLVAFDINNSNFFKWFDTFKRIYFHHTIGRKAFSLLEPRPAILEAISQHKYEISIGYFDSSEVCSTTADWSSSYSPEIVTQIKGTNVLSSQCYVGHIMNHTNSQGLTQDILNLNHKHRHHLYGESRCHHLSIYRIDSVTHTDSLSQLTGIEIYCGNADDNNECLILDVPTYWKQTIQRNVQSDMSQFARRSIEEIKENVMHLMWYGVLRFRNTTTSDEPRKFCFDSGSPDYEELSQSRIEYNTSVSIPFPHSDYQRYNTYKSNITAVLMTGTIGSGDVLANKLYLSLSKLYYSKRHGYKYVTTTSNEFVDYFHPHIFKSLKSDQSQSSYFRGIMTKPLMILHVMLNNLDKDWLVWTDDDLYINPGFLYMPLDVYLSDIPANKVYVAANYRSAFTNIFAIRNNEQGRRLVRDWVAIVMSGYIQCHGFDQAAIGLLILQRFTGDRNFSTPYPFNYTCLYSEEGTNGCNLKGDWSCDFKFEKALYNAGFKTIFANHYHGGKISAYTKGCANDYVEDFHIITETPTRPRLQCGLCTRLNEIESSGHWDGDLGGGNSKLIRGSLNGWFFNHKGEFLFYESYINPNACRKIENFVPKCAELENDMPTDNNEQVNPRTGRHLLPIADGYAYDIDKGQYCQIVNPAVLQHQKENTYMKDYKMIIELVKNIPEDQWIEMYQSYGGGEGRTSCQKNHCRFGAEVDGQMKRRPGKGLSDDQFFEPENYCSVCHEVEIDHNNVIHQYSKISKAYDCRSVNDANRETQQRVNVD